MGDEDESGAVGAVEIEEGVDDGGCGIGIEVAGGFVREEDFGAVHEGARDADALLFAAGELGGVVVEARGEADFFEEFDAALFGIAVALEFERDHDVFEGGEGGDELEVLEDEADFAVADACAFVLADGVEGVSGEGDGARGGAVEAGAEAEECGFSAAGGADDGGGGAGGEGEVDGFQDGERAGLGGVGFGELLGLEDGRL